MRYGRRRMFDIVPTKPLTIKIDYEWIIDRLNEHAIYIDQYELEKVEKILRELDKEQRHVER